MIKEQIVDCLLCGGSAKLKQEECPGYQEPDVFKIYHCQTCNSAFSLPRVETSLIYDNIYKNGNKVPGYDRYWGYADQIKSVINPLEYLSEIESTYWGVKEALDLVVKNKKETKILEVGSGLGYLTYSLIKADYNAVGLDISSTAVNQAILNFGNNYICEDLFNYSKLNEGYFDIVILTEVIEHVDKPLDFIETIQKLLKPGGHAIITTPNKSLYPSDIAWKTELPPVHFWWFSEDSLSYIANKFNMKVDFICFKNFFRKNYRVYNLVDIRNNIDQKSIFNKNGLLKENSKNIIYRQSSLRLLLYKIPFFKQISRKFRDNLNPNFIRYSVRGDVLCAVLKNNSF